MAGDRGLFRFFSSEDGFPGVAGPEARLSDLPGWVGLGAGCGRCRMHASLDRASLERRFGRDARLIDLVDRLRCSRCENRAGSTFYIVKLPR